jgi:putative FmdB family regulatory protein
MPTYQYKCRQCGSDLEVVQKFTDDPLTVCPECSGELRKVYSAVGVVFKGSGFYVTDSKSSSKANLISHEPKSEGKAETKSESKPEAKSEPAASVPERKAA